MVFSPEYLKSLTVNYYMIFTGFKKNIFFFSFICCLCYNCCFTVGLNIIIFFCFIYVFGYKDSNP